SYKPPSAPWYRPPCALSSITPACPASFPGPRRASKLRKMRALPICHPSRRRNWCGRCHLPAPSARRTGAAEAPMSSLIGFDTATLINTRAFLEICNPSMALEHVMRLQELLKEKREDILRLAAEHGARHICIF